MDRYVQAVRRAGGRPAAGYCPAPDPACAGLLLCGGGDLDPAWFGQPDRGSHPPDRARDRAELALVRAYLAEHKPILGVCRGMQVLNVALGGDLIQDLPPETAAFHRGEEDVYHPVRLDRDSLLGRLYGPRAGVNSAHHQAVGRVASDLRATAWAEAGFPEGVEHRFRPAVGVQFHPERLDGALGGAAAADGDALFRWLISACRGGGACQG